MGYVAYSNEAKFFMKQECAEDALAALKALFENITQIGWVADTDIKDCDTFEDAMYECGFELEADDEIFYHICFVDEKWSDNDRFLQAIAPFVQPGSYIQMVGEDGTIWREVFENGTCNTKVAELVFK